MSIVTVVLRDGVEFTPEAARAFVRAEAAWGSEIDTNSTYRSWDTQLAMYEAWNAWINGTGPKPNHSRAIHPKYSRHTNGTAFDSDDWVKPGFVALMKDHGFIRVASDELHHFEYVPGEDNHQNDSLGEDEMIINIKGKRGERRGGLYLVMNGVASFIGARSIRGGYPMFTNEAEIQRLQERIKGLK